MSKGAAQPWRDTLEFCHETTYNYIQQLFYYIQRRSNTLVWEGFCTRDLVTRLVPARPNSHDEYDVDTVAEFGIQLFRTGGEARAHVTEN